MKYSKEEVMQYVAEEDVKFVRMAFCDVFGKQKNISVMPCELERAFRYGITIDASAVAGFGGNVRSDLILHPDPSTLSLLPWRPEHGRVVRMYCNITYPDNTPFENDTRNILINAISKAEKKGIHFHFGSEMEFYLFKRDEDGDTTFIPYDNAGYMDIAPEDKGENVRREICLTLEQMGIIPESSHHEEGPGQNEIDFKYSDPLRAADDAVTFKSVVNTVASRSGLYADFSPKPLVNFAGNGMHINVSARANDKRDVMPQIIQGILSHIKEMTLFLNTTEESYKRFGSNKAPKYVSWGKGNRSQLIRIPAAEADNLRAELRSPDPMCNPYLAYALVIFAGLSGLEENAGLIPETDCNMYEISKSEKFELLPTTLAEAADIAKSSSFISKVLPESIIKAYLK